MAKNIYLQCEFGSGKIYEFSKTEKEGFEEYKNSKGVVTYRKYFKKGLYGIYKGVSVRDSQFGKEVSLCMMDKDRNTIYLNFPLYDAKDNIAAYTESLIRVLPAMEVGFAYRIFPYAIDVDGTDWKNYGVSVKHADIYEETVREDYPLELVSSAYYKKDGDEHVLVEGDIPPIEWKKKAGKNVKNRDERDDYLYKLLMTVAKDQTKDRKKEQVEKGEAPKPAVLKSNTIANAEPPKKAVIVDEDDDDGYGANEANEERDITAPPQKATVQESSTGTTEGGQKVELPF